MYKRIDIVRQDNQPNSGFPPTKQRSFCFFPFLPRVQFHGLCHKPLRNMVDVFLGNLFSRTCKMVLKLACYTLFEIQETFNKWKINLITFQVRFSLFDKVVTNLQPFFMRFFLLNLLCEGNLEATPFQRSKRYFLLKESPTS